MYIEHDLPSDLTEIQCPYLSFFKLKLKNSILKNQI